MEPARLLQVLSDARIELWPIGDRIRFRPYSDITPDLLEELREHKWELLSMLASSGHRPPPYNCIKCGSPVVLQQWIRGGGWIYRCSCGNESKIAAKDYEKLRAFDVMAKENEERSLDSASDPFAEPEDNDEINEYNEESRRLFETGSLWGTDDLGNMES